MRENLLSSPTQQKTIYVLDTKQISYSCCCAEARTKRKFTAVPAVWWLAHVLLLVGKI